MTLKADQTYLLQELVLTSSTSADDQIETGTFTDNGEAFILTPASSSCSPFDGTISAVNYHIDGDSISLSFPEGVLLMNRDTAPASTNAVIQFGCFGDGGVFTPEPNDNK